MLSRINKKIILLCSVEAPFWSDALPKVTRLHIKSALGISPTTMIKWEMGGEVRNVSLHKAFKTMAETVLKQRSMPKDARATVLERIEELHTAIFDNDTSVYAFGERLGFDKTQSQKAIDQEVFKKIPVFRDIYYEDSPRDRSMVQKHFDAFGGCYHVWLERGERTFQGVLRVRYPLHLKTLWAIRAKLNLPKYVNTVGKQKPFFEYDGFLSIKSDVIFWMFEERDNLNADFFHMITERPDLLEGGGLATGKYLTTQRGKDASIETGRVLIERRDIETATDIEEFMFDGMTLLDEPFDAVLERETHGAPGA